MAYDSQAFGTFAKKKFHGGGGFNKSGGFHGGGEGGGFHGGGFKSKFKKPYDQDESKGFHAAPPEGAEDGLEKLLGGAGEPEGKGEEGKENNENKEQEGSEEETIEKVLDLFDQLTPLIEKLRDLKK